MKKWRMLLLALLLALLCGCAASEALPDYAPEESQRLILYTSHKKEDRRMGHGGRGRLQ